MKPGFIYTLEIAQRSKKWAFWGQPAPKEAMATLWAIKVIAALFWEECGMTDIDYIDSGKTK